MWADPQPGATVCVAAAMQGASRLPVQTGAGPGVHPALTHGAVAPLAFC